MIDRPARFCALLCILGASVLSAQSSLPGSGDSSQNPQNLQNLQNVQNPQTQQNQQSLLPYCTADIVASGQPCQQGLEIPQVGSPNLGTTPPEGPQTSQNGRERPQVRQFPPDLPTEFQKFVAETTGEYLKIYGQDLFRKVPSTFAPSDQVPVPPQYVIGPGDELKIHLWGQINFSGNLRVDRSGNIYLPKVGAVSVVGLPFSALDQHLRTAVSKIFRNFDLSVEIGAIRSIQIYVSGQARMPGAYTISSLSSLVDALFASGGPSPQGSLRHVLLRREGQTVSDFDLYALLIHGDKSKDIRLLPEDVIYIPSAGPEVALTGSVRIPGIYELRSGETIGDLLEFAGKTTAVASKSRITLERIKDHRTQDVSQVDFNPSGLATPLADGDILRINPIVPAYDQAVTLRGNVANPGRFSWHQGMRLSELIPDRNSLISRNYWWSRSHHGLPSPEFETGISTLGTFKLGAPPQTPQEAVTNALTPKNQNQPDTTPETETPAPDSAPQRQRNSSSTIAAEISQNPTPNREVPRKNDITLSPDEINWDYAVIERVDPQSLKPSLLPFDLGKLVLEHDPAMDLELQPGDTVTIFSQSDIRVPLNRQVKYIDLEGEFVHPGYYSVGPGETLRDLVRRAGGLTPQAYLYGSEFTRESTRILQQQRLDEYVRSLTIDAQRGAQQLAISSSSGAGAVDAAATRAANQDMIARLKQLKATGRIVLQFLPNSTRLDEVPAFSLENGDRFLVPFAPASVNVVGAVYDQNSFVYRPGKTLAYYLGLAGGSNRNADWRHAFLVRADGSVISQDHSGGSGFWKQSFTGLRLYPGDTVVVPDKVLRPSALRAFADWSQVFAQLAIGAAAIHSF